MQDFIPEGKWKMAAVMGAEEELIKTTTLKIKRHEELAKIEAMK